jgi:diguanylate cyclase (GGDEF)-like protein
MSQSRQTIFILGTDAERNAQLKAILRAGIPDTIVTVSADEPIPRITKSDSVILTTEEIKGGEAYQQLISRLEQQVSKGKILSELVRLTMTAPTLEEMLDNVAAKSTEILGDTSLIVLDEDARYQLEAAFSSDANRLKRMLMTAVNVSPHTVASELLHGALDRGEPLVVSNLQQLQIASELQTFVEKYGLRSLIVTPIRSRDRTLGAFVSISAAPQILAEHDLAPASELADFTAMIVEHARLVAELQRSATTDPLTGVYNTRFFHEVLNREAARAQRYRTALSLLMIDVDSFKAINDTYGHVVGDKVLLHIGQLLASSVRATDLVFRCGGDEFCVVLPGTNAEGALNVASKILEKVRAADVLKSLGHPGSTSVSIGVAEYQPPNPAESLVSNADQALYTSKRTSRNTVTVYRKPN